MKKIPIILSLGACGFEHSIASTVVLQFDSVVENVVQGNGPKVGTPFHVTVQYEVPRVADFNTDTAAQYVRVQAASFAAFGDTVYAMDEMFAQVGVDPDNPGWRVFIRPSDKFGTFEPELQNMALIFRSEVKFFDDSTRLPSSFSEWNLPAANFEMSLTNSQLPGVIWSVTSRTATNMSLQIIPEPGVAAYALAVTAAGFLSRRRGRAACGIPFNIGHPRAGI